MQNSETINIKRTEKISLTSLDDVGLTKLSSERLLSLSLDEMRSVQRYFRSVGREPTDVELETIAQTWSEHCKHKTFRGIIDYTDEESDSVYCRGYDNLLKETIVRATKELNKRFCLSVFEDNAGIISFDKKSAIAFKVETHNHPSALEPYGGAGTGIGGVIRDILGVGLGAKPVLNTDVFCVGEFGDHYKDNEDSGILPPERILPGVISGVRDYGNRMGIPTSNGAVLFHKGYYANPLVFCGTVGLIPKDKIMKKVSPGELVVAIGGRTGRDGIHGATFSSLALEKYISASVVQIGNAIVEKKAAEVVLHARDKNLFNAITDCGAGGFSSAVGELGSETGAKVYLEKAPLKYEGLLPWEIWVSESQERMVFSVPKENLAEFQEICRTEDVECSVIGEFTDTKRLEVFYRDEKVCDLDVKFLHDGTPRIRKEAVWNGIKRDTQNINSGIRVKEKDFSKILKKLVAHPNIAVKKWVIRQYDHEVQGGSIIKPLVGSHAEGPGDAVVFRPHLNSWKGVAISNGINPFYGEIDPYWMAANVVDEALRNLVAVGGKVEHCALLDNFCWGDVNDPEVLGGLVRCAQGCYDFSKGFGVPFISGKDSLNNTWRERDGKVVSIPSTLLISAVSIVDDVRKCVTMDFKKDGNFIALIGETKNELGGSHFNKVLDLYGGKVPEVEVKHSKKMMLLIHRAITKGLIRSCHDLSEGGLAVSLSEMCLAGSLGAEIDLSILPTLSSDKVDNNAVLLFSESASRWLVEIEPQKIAQIKKMFSSISFAVIGKVKKNPILKIRREKEILKLSVSELKKLWNAFSDQQCQ